VFLLRYTERRERGLEAVKKVIKLSVCVFGALVSVPHYKRAYYARELFRRANHTEGLVSKALLTTVR